MLGFAAVGGRRRRHAARDAARHVLPESTAVLRPIALQQQWQDSAESQGSNPVSDSQPQDHQLNACRACKRGSSSSNLSSHNTCITLTAPPMSTRDWLVGLPPPAPPIVEPPPSASAPPSVDVLRPLLLLRCARDLRRSMGACGCTGSAPPACCSRVPVSRPPVSTACRVVRAAGAVRQQGHSQTELSPAGHQTPHQPPAAPGCSFPAPPVSTACGGQVFLEMTGALPVAPPSQRAPSCEVPSAVRGPVTRSPSTCAILLTLGRQHKRRGTQGKHAQPHLQRADEAGGVVVAGHAGGDEDALVNDLLRVHPHCVPQPLVHHLWVAPDYGLRNPE